MRGNFHDTVNYMHLGYPPFNFLFNEGGGKVNL